MLSGLLLIKCYSGGVADAPLIYLSPRGRPLTQARVRALAGGPGVKLLCGRFEGLDQRVIDAYEMEEISVGDYILSGGEIAAMVLLDAAARLLPGVIGDAASLAEESFEKWCAGVSPLHSSTGLGRPLNPRGLAVR